MSDIILSFLSALFSEAPTLMLALLGFVMAMFGTTGVFIGGGKIDVKTRRILRLFGWLLFILFLSITVFQVGIDKFSLIQTYFDVWGFIWNDIYDFLIRTFTPVVWLIIGLIGLTLIIIDMIIKKQIQKQYELKFFPQVYNAENEDESSRATIDVENLEKRSGTYIARLAKVGYKPLRGKLFENQEIRWVNRKDSDLAWGNDFNKSAVIRNDGIKRPTNVVRLIEGGRFTFLSESAVHNFLIAGYYEIQVAIFIESQSKKYIKVQEFHGILKVRKGRSGDSPKLEWQEKGVESEHKKNTKKTTKKDNP